MLPENLINPTLMSKLSAVFKKNRLDKIIFWLVLGLLVFIPLYPKLPLIGVSGSFVSIRLEDLLIAVILLLWAAAIAASHSIKAVFQNRVNQALLLFFFIGAVSLFSAVFLTHTVAPNLAILHYLRRVELMLLLPVAYYSIRSKKQLVVVLLTISTATLLVNVYAIGQKYLDWPVISTGNSEFAKGIILHLTPGARVNSTFAGHYDLAVYLTMFIVGAAAIFFGVKSWLVRAWSAALMGFSFVVLMMTAARLSFVATLAGVVISVFLSGKKLLILAVILLAVGALAYPSQMRDRLISTVTVNIEKEGTRYVPSSQDQNARSKLNIPTLPNKVSTASTKFLDASEAGKMSSDIAPGEPTDITELGVYRSFGIRLDQEWPRALRALEKNPLLGTGYSSLGLATDNDYLRSLGEVGLLGSLAFLLIIVEVAKRFWSNFRSSRGLVKYFSAGLLSLVFGFLLNATFIDVFEASKVATLFWLILGIGLAVEKFK